ncbi:hypothetical protein ACP0HM_25640 [Escherichia coli]
MLKTAIVFLSSPQPSTIRCWWITPKNRITEETLAKLQDLAKECDLAGAIKSMFSGEKINRTEKPRRAARSAA